MSFKTINPATGESIKTFRDEGVKTIQEKINKSAFAYKDWKKLAFPVRSKILMDVVAILKKNREEYAGIITLEMGKPIIQSLDEVDKCAGVCKYYAENTKFFLKEEIIKTDALNSYVSFEPMGVILAIMPWNFPFWQVFRFAAPALMAGNSILLKHAPNVPQCSLAIEDIFRQAGLPDGIFQNLFIDTGKIRRVIENKAISAITLTGSNYAGSKVAEIAGKNIKKLVLELGGSDPFIVFREANLKEAAKTAIKSRMQNTGQSCIAAKRIIVEKSVSESFLKILKQEFEKLTFGDPMSDDTDIGPLAKEEFQKQVHDQVRSSVKKGAVIEFGGIKPKRKGYYYKPTLLTNVQPGMPVFDEEVFGPVLPVIIAKDDEEAIQLANQTQYGLGASIWTENREQAARAVKQIQAGMVVVNGMVVSDPKIPFGGIKQSGIGRELAQYGIREFVNVKSIIFK